MDALDREIIAALQADGKLGLSDLASKIGLTVSPTHRRVRDLESLGAISGYRAVVDPRHLGLGFEALVFVTMKQEDRTTLLAFEEAVAQIPNVLQVQRLFGNPDYLLRVCTESMDDYARLQDNLLGALPGVMRMDSTPVMKNVVMDRPYPTDLT